MISPLTKTQEHLRGRKISEMTLQQLLEWIEACSRMEKWKHTPKKARHEWKDSRAEAERELQKRRNSE